MRAAELPFFSLLILIKISIVSMKIMLGRYELLEILVTNSANVSIYLTMKNMVGVIGFSQ